MITSRFARRAVGVVLTLLAAFAVSAQAQEPTPRRRVGLALGGGSAKGIAHAGVLQWLEEHHVPVDAIAGTSTGAAIGGAYAIGMSAAEIQDLLRTTDWEEVQRPDIPFGLRSFRRKEDDREYRIKLDAGLRHGFRLQSGMNPGHRVGLLLSRIVFPYSSIDSFDELAIPFRCVATDLEKGEVVVLDHGPLGPALRASMALPGTFDTVRLSGRLLSDGGILDSVPVDVVRDMGVDVVIAVAMNAPESAKPAETIPAVANRAVDLMMRGLEKPRLQQADVVILPDLTGLKSSDFQKSDELAARGYAAAAASADALLRYALDGETWERYRQALQQRRRPRNGPLGFVEVTGTSAAAAAQIAGRLEPTLAQAVDTTAIETQLDRIVGNGRYASAMYDRRWRADREGLGVEIRDKSYAPPLVKFRLDLDNENQDLNLTLGTRVTLMDLTGLGSEWRFDSSLGSSLRLATELFQPVAGGAPLRSGGFVAPRAFYTRASENFYQAEALRAIYRRQRAGLGFDAGWTFGRSAQIRGGYEVSTVSDAVLVGDPFPGSAGGEQAASLRFQYEGQDRPYFPTRGVRFSSRAAWFVEAPGTSDFGKLEGSFSVAWQIATRHNATFYADGGTAVGKATPFLYQFSLGGPFRLGAFAPNALRGPDFLLGGVGYRAPFGRLPRFLGDRWYLTALVEAGSVFDRIGDARVKTSLTGGLAAETILGPVFIGGSVGNAGFRAYVVVGALVR